MERWKKILNKILYPPGWLLFLLTVVSAAGLIYVFMNGLEEAVIAYGMYAVSSYTVTVLTVFLVLALPKKYREIRQRVYENPLGNRYMTDVAFKVKVSLHISLGINLIYSAFNLCVGIIYRTYWLGGFAVYYILLSVIRFTLLYHMERKKDAGLAGEYRSYRFSAILMLFINLALSGIILYMIVKNEVAPYSDIYVIASATYTFYMLTVSIVDMVRYRKYESPVLSAAKAIRFTQALVSLLSLEAAMLVQFGDSEFFRRLMLSLSGAGVSIIVLVLSVFMIVRANREMERLREE